jgi:hypothetical protein
MKTGEKLSLCLLLLIVFAGSVAAQELITNVYGRNIHSLNGKWNAIIDLYDQGQRMKIYENRQPEEISISTNTRLKAGCVLMFRETGTLNRPN